MTTLLNLIAAAALAWGLWKHLVPVVRAQGKVYSEWHNSRQGEADRVNRHNLQKEAGGVWMRLAYWVVPAVFVLVFNNWSPWGY